MAIPSNPLLTELITEGINQAGEYSPSQALLLRAQNEWAEEIKNEIWHLSKRPKILQVTAYTIIYPGQSRYAFPTDYSSDLFLTLLWGSDQNTCQTGTASTITLNANDTSGSNIIGKEVLMTAGNSTGSYAQIVAYNSITKIASVIPDFNTAPSANDSYMIIDTENPVETRPIFDWDARSKWIGQGLPERLYPQGDDSSGYFVFDKPPDVMRGARLRYYSDITQLDVTSTLMSVIYRKWRNVFVKGIKARKLADEDDDSSDKALNEYNKELRNMIYREIYGMDISNLTDRIVDYGIISGVTL